VGLLQQTFEFAEIQFTKHLIEFVLVETNKLTGNNPHVILMQQTLPVLEPQGCGKQTPSASMLFFRTNLVYILNIDM